MSDHERHNPVLAPERPPQLVVLEGGGDEPPPLKPKIKWLRLLALLTGIGLLALVSAVFGMLMAVASDLPQIDVLDVSTRTSRIVDRNGHDLGVLTGNQNRILVKSSDIAPVMKHAIVSIEDKRFYTNSGVDIRGIARAVYQDVVAKKAVQGGSTIAQQLVKNRLEAQNNRTIFQKLREAAMAFHMTRKWDKERILRNYLNTIYFGNGAYGIESAARTYFGSDYGLNTEGATPQCGSGPRDRRCAALLEPEQAALLAGMVANPSAFDPIAHPEAAKARRDVVLKSMLDQGYIDRFRYQKAIGEPVPTRDDIHPPQETSKYPYFTSWVRQQVVDKVGAGMAFAGGLKVHTTIDSELQQAAENAVKQIGVGPNVPSVALVTVDNRTSEVLAMVGDSPGGYNVHPFNLATQGQRQPGSSFKPFVLAQALEDGISPTSTWTSHKKEFCVTRSKGRCREVFTVNNYNDAYSGVTTLANATAFSDNSVFAEVGIKVGTKKIAKLAQRMGIRTPVSSNFAMTLGGLRTGVNVLDMAHAYETFASGGKLIYGSLSPGVDNYESNDHKGIPPGPVGIQEIEEPNGTKWRAARLLDGDKAVNHERSVRVLPQGVAETATSILQGVVRIGSGKRATLGPDIPVSGKTGTTEDYGDAWFVGWTPRYTTAVWIGYPDKVKSMKPPTFSWTDGEPVAGGTWPAYIWATYMKQAMAIYARRHPEKPKAGATGPTGVVGAPSAPTAAPVVTAAPTTAAPKKQQKAPEQPAPEQPAQQPAQEQQPAEPQPTPQGGGVTPPPSGGAAPPDG